MFRKPRMNESLETASPTRPLQWRRLALVAALVLAAGSLPAEPTPWGMHDDSLRVALAPSRDELAPSTLSSAPEALPPAPEMLPPPSPEVMPPSPEELPPPAVPRLPANREGLPETPDDNQPRPEHRHRFHEADPEGAPRYHRSRERHDPRHEELLPEREQIQHKLTGRYGNPAVVRLVRSLPAEQSLQLYLEISGMIDARHLKPSTYDARVKRAVKNLCEAMENRNFLQANGLGGDPSRLEAFRSDLVRLEGRRMNSPEEAYQAVQWAVQAGERDAGLRPSAIVLEFIYGATDSLDKYSAFVPAMGRSSPSAELEDHIVGIGVEIKADDAGAGMLIANALPGGPAAEAGLRKGDVIESIDGQKVSGATLDSAVDLISGPAGSRITLEVRRDDRVAQVQLVRRRVEVHSVSEVKMLENNVGYIKLDKFAQNSSDECDTALWSLYRQGMKSLIVDVRGNPGGLLTTAIQMSNKFVPSGTIVSTRGRDATDNLVEYAHRQHAWKTPLVVLVDENSASASEIFAAAVQENGRGLVVGRRTYGKGTVQTHFPLQTVSGSLRLTTAQFFSPKGRTMAGAGVEPDVLVEAEHGGQHADYPRDAPSQHDAHYEHEPPYERDGLNHHEAAYRHGASYRSGPSDGSDREIGAAIEAATSREAFDLARKAGVRRNGDDPGRPAGR